MGPLDLANHLLSFAAPALAVALCVAFGARWLLRGDMRRGAWWPPVALNFGVGVAALAAGLVFCGRDGKMATYCALVLAVATAQWLYGRGWRR
jgi:hypothetical protein